jgi:RNA polymerase sigma-70 factor (ECF subfamily)
MRPLGDTFAGRPVAASSDDAEAGRTSPLEERVTALYDDLRLPVYRYLLHVGVPPQNADEMIQETFLRLYRHLKREREDENIRGWVFRVAQNLAFNDRKSRNRLWLPAPDQWEGLAGASPGANPEELLIRRERMTRLHSAMRQLSDQQLQCLRLRAEGFRYREIGNILGVSISTVAESLRRAVGKLTRSIHGEK